MNVSEIMGSRAQSPRRRVGVKFADRHGAMDAAVDLYRQVGLDVEVEENLLFINCGQAISGRVLELIEGRTGVQGFNDWRR